MQPPHWLETLSWGANVLLALCGVFALAQIRAAVRQAEEAAAQTKLLLEQLKTSQEEISHRSKRDAIAVALDQSEIWASQILPLFEVVHENLRNAGYEFPKEVDEAFSSLPPINPSPQFTELNKSAIGLLNKVEAFAMHFESGLADESVAFPPVASGYCDVCLSLSKFIRAFRPTDNHKLFPNLVQLYQRWKPRLRMAGLDVRLQALSDEKRALPPDRPGVPLGTERAR